MCVYVYMHIELDFECLGRKMFCWSRLCCDVHVVMCWLDCVRVLSLLYLTPKYLHDDESCTVNCLCRCYQYVASDKGQHCVFTVLAIASHTIFFCIFFFNLFRMFFVSLLLPFSLLFFALDSLFFASIWSSLFSILNLSSVNNFCDLLDRRRCRCRCCCCCCISYPRFDENLYKCISLSVLLTKIHNRTELV